MNSTAQKQLDSDCKPPGLEPSLADVSQVSPPEIAIAATPSSPSSDPTDDAQEHDIILGREVRNLRRSIGMTIAQLAQSTKTSVGHISQLERGLSSCSVLILKRIAATLGVSPGWFFGEPQTRGKSIGKVIRPADRTQLHRGGNGLYEEVVFAEPEGALEVILSRLEPGADNTCSTRAGEDAGLVLEGKLEVWLGNTHYKVQAGDLIMFRGQPARIRNATTTQAVVAWVAAR